MLRLLLFFLLAAPAFLPAQDQATLNQMAADEADQADKELNAVYGRVLTTLDGEGQTLLRKSQSAWLAFRDAEADFAADEMRGGSAAPLLYYGRLARLTKERTAALRGHLETAGEDSGKPAGTEPEGAESIAKAGQLFFDAYAGHNRSAAAKVASEKVLADLLWDAKSGTPEGLQLMDPTHIYYVGGSIEMKMKQNAAGRWFVNELEMTAD